MALAGISNITMESSLAGSLDKGSGNGPMFGGRLAWYWTAESGWQYGVQAEWTKSEADLTTNTALGTYESTVSNSGVSARATLGYRF
ncbi:MAG TPA: hypothetical protein DCS97_04965 [Planctomycetes bacterium]|nr:hypothetical protein [Planctomycetota bacterium]